MYITYEFHCRIGKGAIKYLLQKVDTGYNRVGNHLVYESPYEEVFSSY